MLSWEPADIRLDDLLIRRFRNSDSLFKLHGNVSRTIFQDRDGSYEAECSFYAKRHIRREKEWCAGPIHFTMATFGVFARVPIDAGAKVKHSPDRQFDAYSHTSVWGLNDIIADTIIDEGKVLTDLPLCRRNVTDRKI